MDSQQAFSCYWVFTSTGLRIKPCSKLPLAATCLQAMLAACVLLLCNPFKTQFRRTFGVGMTSLFQDVDQRDSCLPKTHTDQLYANSRNPFTAEPKKQHCLCLCFPCEPEGTVTFCSCHQQQQTAAVWKRFLFGHGMNVRPSAQDRNSVPKAVSSFTASQKHAQKGSPKEAEELQSVAGGSRGVRGVRGAALS